MPIKLMGQIYSELVFFCPSHDKKKSSNRNTIIVVLDRSSIFFLCEQDMKFNSDHFGACNMQFAETSAACILLTAMW